MDNTGLSLSRADLEQVVRNGLKLESPSAIAISEVTRWANLNYVFRVTFDDTSLYLKAVTASPKHLRITLPKERIAYEAQAIRLFRGLAGPTVVLPDVLFVDHQNHVLAMSDVGQERSVLLEVIDEHYDLLVAQAVPLGSALGRVHAGSRGDKSFRPREQDGLLRAIIIDGLLAPGAQALFPERWPEIVKQLGQHCECLVHNDLWGKNLLVKHGAPPSIVDFEGASVGDPALDMATLLAVALIPALEQSSLIESCIGFSRALVGTYQETVNDDAWLGEVCVRAYLYAGTCLAARGFGPFAYDMSAKSRQRLARCARSLTLDPPDTLAAYCERLRGYE